MYASVNYETHTSKCILCCMAAYASSTVGSQEATTIPPIPIVGSCVAETYHFLMLGHRRCREGLDLGVHG